MSHKSGSDFLSSHLSLTLSSDTVSLHPRTQNRLAAVEARAAQLMDELFQDLEPYLDSSDSPQIDHLPRASSPTSTAPLALPPDATLEREEWVACTELTAQLEAPKHNKNSLPPSLFTQSTAGKDRELHRRRMWFALISTSLVMGTIAWIGNQLQVVQVPVPVATQAEQRSSKQAQREGVAPQSSPSPPSKGAATVATPPAAVSEKPRVPELNVSEAQVPAIGVVTIKPSRIPEVKSIKVASSPATSQAQPSHAPATNQAQPSHAPVKSPVVVAPPPLPSAAPVQAQPPLPQIAAVTTPRQISVGPSPAPASYVPKYKFVGVIGQIAAIELTDGSKQLSHVKAGQVLNSNLAITSINTNLSTITVQHQGQTREIQVGEAF